MLGHVGAGEQRGAGIQGAGGEVLGQLGPDRRVGDETGGGDPLLDLAADVGGVPRRPPCPQPGQHGLDAPASAVEATEPRTTRHRHTDAGGSAGAGERVAVAEGVQLLGPAGDQGGAVGGDDLVGAGLLPGPPVPRLPQPRAGFLAGVGGAPLGLVAVDVAADLRGPGTEPADERRQLGDLTGGRVEGEPGPASAARNRGRWSPRRARCR